MQVEVHNLNSYPYAEKFREIDIQIPAKSYIEMEYEEAVAFRGTINDVERDGDGNILPSSYKMIKIVMDGAGKAMMEEYRKRAVAFKCQACGYLAEDKQALHIHVKEEHAHQLEDPKVAKQMLKKK